MEQSCIWRGREDEDDEWKYGKMEVHMRSKNDQMEVIHK